MVILSIHLVLIVASFGISSIGSRTYKMKLITFRVDMFAS